ncbi:MAG: EAL domain-containing protein [Gammaproteobacteria bacterium]|nr:EAL domain-containing protein [Gammaproteobacteria bacterium]MDH5799618.1 EAL domain-containing protein [Gammaproteobacteria bacterium]
MASILPDEQNQRKLDRIREDYLRELPEKIAGVEQLWSELVHCAWDDGEFSQFHIKVHSLAGSAGTFGLEELSNAARQLSDLLTHISTTQRRPDESQRLHINALVRVLVRTANPLDPDLCERIQQAAPEPKEPLPTSDKQHTIYIVDDDHQLGIYLGTLLSGLGYTTRNFDDPSAALAYVEKSQPDLVIMDIMFQNKTGFDSVLQFREVIGKNVPFIFMSARSDLESRVQSVRSGGNAYFTKPVDIEQLHDGIEKLLSQSMPRQRVLIVDDDVELSCYYAQHLDNVGFEVEIVNDPAHMLKDMENFSPELVIMDYHMPKYNGFDLIKVMQQTQQYAETPVLFLTADNDADLRETAIGLGVNDFLIKPIGTDELIGSVRRLMRSSASIQQMKHKISQHDPVSGLHNHRYFLQQLELAAAPLAPGDKAVALAFVAVDNYETIKERVDIYHQSNVKQQLYTLLRSSLNRDDIATEFSDGIFLVLLKNRRRDDLPSWSNSLNKKFSSNVIHLSDHDINICCSISLTPLDKNSSGVEELLFQAQQSCKNIQTKGGNNTVVSKPEVQDTPIQYDIKKCIDTALAQNLFELVYQPIINIENRNFEQYEVLLRMRTPDSRLVPPQQFFATAAKSGQTTKIDRWVIEHAITNMSANSHIRSNTDLFIKLTGKTLTESMLIPWISNSLTQSHVSGERRVIFAVNEKDWLLHGDYSERFNRNIKALQCGIAIDHFGITNNSAQLLSKLRPNYVVFRGSVLDGILDTSDKMQQLRSLILHATKYEVKIIAGSIENPAVLSTLWSMGIRYFQGFFIQEPNANLEFDFGSFRADDFD